jgi:hypothetical protein
VAIFKMINIIGIKQQFDFDEEMINKLSGKSTAKQYFILYAVSLSSIPLLKHTA